MISANNTHNTLRAVKLCSEGRNYTEAESLLRKLLTHVETKYGKSSLDAAYVGSELANVLEHQGKTEESEVYLKSVRKILIDEVRSAHPDWQED